MRVFLILDNFLMKKLTFFTASYPMETGIKSSILKAVWMFFLYPKWPKNENLNWKCASRHICSLICAKFKPVGVDVIKAKETKNTLELEEFRAESQTRTRLHYVIILSRTV